MFVYNVRYLVFQWMHACFVIVDCFLPAGSRLSPVRTRKVTIEKRKEKKTEKHTTDTNDSGPGILATCFSTPVKRDWLLFLSSSSSSFPLYHRSISSSILLNSAARNRGFQLLQSAQGGPYETPLQSSCQHIFFFWRKTRAKLTWSISSLFFTAKCKSYLPYLYFLQPPKPLPFSYLDSFLVSNGIALGLGVGPVGG